MRGSLVTQEQLPLEVLRVALFIARRQGSTEPGAQVESLFAVLNART